MSNDPHCPKCHSEHTYPDRTLWVCSACYHEWNPSESTKTDEEGLGALNVVDSNGTVLKDGDSVTVIKDLKVKGFPTALKVGTKVKGIRLVESNDGHNIDCKIEGFGGMYLKSEFVKKV
jgi:protein PhnA